MITRAAAVLAASLMATAADARESAVPDPAVPADVTDRADLGNSGPVVVMPDQYRPSFLGRMADTVGYYAAFMWDSVAGTFAPPTPASFASGVAQDDPYSFWTLLSDAGYKLKEIESDVGLIPDISLKFKHVRELSEADVTWLERKLEKHAKLHPDWISALQRSIVYTLLQINDSNDYFVETLTVEMLPLPKAKFSLEPWEGGLPEEFDILLRAIQGREITPRRGPRGDS